MNKKVTSILSYCSIVGWLIGFLGGDKENAKFDLNQGLVLGILGVAATLTGQIFGYIPIALIRWPITLACTAIQVGVVILSVFGIIAAAKGQEKELPVVGQIKILK